jgi:hypothetical protein
MSKIHFFALVGVVAALAAAGTAWAASPHFKKGGTPTCTISGTGTSSTSTTCTGTLTGLSGADLYVNTIVSGSATYTCTNGGGNAAPGQNQVQFGPSTTSTPISGAQTKNGNLTFNTAPNTLSASPTVTGTQAGCPNNNWTGTNPQLTVTSVELQIGYTGQQAFYDCTVAPTGSTATFPASC